MPMSAFIVVLAVVLTLLADQAIGHGTKPHDPEPSAVVNPTKPTTDNGQDRRAEKLSEISAAFSDSVRPIFEKKCADCHSGKTAYPWYHSVPGIKQLLDQDIAEGRSHLDFSNGFPFRSHGTPEEDLAAIREAAESRSMPPRTYLLMHSGSSLTEADIKTILTWTDLGLAKLRSAP